MGSQAVSGLWVSRIYRVTSSNDGRIFVPAWECWPGLAKKDLFEGRDLMATLDYRAVCAACIEAAFGLQHDVIADQVFFEPKLPRIHDDLFA